MWNRFVSAVNLGEHLKTTHPKAVVAPPVGASVAARVPLTQPLLAAGMATVITKKLAIQAVAVGFPYLAENSNEILSKILAQTNAKMFK